jgi:hypothetical protein
LAREWASQGISVELIEAAIRNEDEGAALAAAVTARQMTVQYLGLKPEA